MFVASNGLYLRLGKNVCSSVTQVNLPKNRGYRTAVIAHNSNNLFVKTYAALG